MKKSLAAFLPRLFFTSVLASLLTLSTGCIVRPIGYGHGHYHHRYHGGYR